MSSAVATRTTSGLSLREARRPVNLTARMRMERGWCDISIRNVSSGGFMGQCQTPPRRGYYIEVWRGEVCVVGYVVWSSGSRFGARSQAKIDIPAFIAKRAAAMPGTERRRKNRRPGTVPPSLQVQSERARLIGRTFEFVAVGAVTAAAAVFLAGAVGEVLNKPFAEIRANLVNANAHAATAQCAATGADGSSGPNCSARLR